MLEFLLGAGVGSVCSVAGVYLWAYMPDRKPKLELVHVESVNFRVGESRVTHRLETTSGLYYAGGSTNNHREQWMYDGSGGLVDRRLHLKLHGMLAMYLAEQERRNRAEQILQAELGPMIAESPVRQPTDQLVDQPQPIPSNAKAALEALDERLNTSARMLAYNTITEVPMKDLLRMAGAQNTKPEETARQEVGARSFRLGSTRGM